VPEYANRIGVQFRHLHHSARGPLREGTPDASPTGGPEESVVAIGFIEVTEE
jgi:hypothetical protein